MRNATRTPIAPRLAARWSPRGFQAAHEISQDELLSIIEAARWAPSAGNTQPWAFVAAKRGTPDFDAIVATLAGFNQSWTPSASALMVFAAVPERAAAMPNWVEYDLGQAAAHATAQAEFLGLSVHQMGGFDAQGLAGALGLPENVNPVTVMAIGAYDDSEAVQSDIRQRDGAERDRLPLEEVLIGTL